MPWINKDLCENKYNWWINGKSELHKLFHHHNKEVLNYLHLILYCFMCFYPCLNLSAVLGVGKSLRNEKIATISLYNDGIPFTKTTTVIYSCHKHNGRFIFHHYQILITWPRRTVISIRRLRHPMSNAELHKSACTHTPFPTHAHIRATSGEGRAPHTLITATSGAGGAPHTHIKVMSGASGATHTHQGYVWCRWGYTHITATSGAGGAPVFVCARASRALNSRLFNHVPLPLAWWGACVGRPVGPLRAMPIILLRFGSLRNFMAELISQKREQVLSHRARRWG